MASKKAELVFIDKFGLLGSNYYWRKRDQYNISVEELKAAGLENDRVRLSPDIIKPLQDIDRELQGHGHRIYISEGYRPNAVYELIYSKRSSQFGTKWTNRLINIKDRPHTTGKTVDVTLWSIKDNRDLVLRDRKDGPEALLIDFYKDKRDRHAKEYQRLQRLLMNVMLSHGFRTGPLREYFHFNYQPDAD